ncbi:MAG: type II toxin-antitoxin system RelE/ParE family toxin [Candidatus Gastranaerophilales bacterium]|nr:type II toxin-antitoxin system RelE/ParE family toxin [Candidatus Gastranaerophilales bacterium]
MKEIVFYALKDGKEPVKEWLDSLDYSIRARIIKRLEHMYDDNFGDYKQLAPNLYELRCSFGAGYRIYYTIKSKVVALLLNAGDKSRQRADILTAKAYLKDLGDKDD